MKGKKISRKTAKVMFVLITIALASTLVSAILLTYFGKVETTMNVTQSVQIDGQNWNQPITHQLDAEGGCCYCYEHTITNNGCEGIWLTWLNSGEPDLEGIDIIISESGECDYGCSTPDEAVDTHVQHWGIDSYFDMTFTDVPDGYIIDDGTYPGWCVDEEHLISNGDYSALLYCICDPENPYPDDDWDYVTWLINNKPQGLTAQQIQYTIWYFIDGGYSGTDQDVLDFIALIEQNGDGFVPECGDLVPILVDVGQEYQKTFVEAVLPCEECECDCDSTPMELPFYLDSEESIDICFCYDLDMLIAPGTYTVSSELVPAIL